jgi:salicylate biosynthesis isochorismate synthase/menaquinone-specific isochorismate synthase
LTTRTGSQPPFSLTSDEDERLAGVLAAAVARARRSGEPTLATLTVIREGAIDPSAVAACSRREGEPWFLFEQPDRGGSALACLGEAVEIRARGRERITSVAERWRALVHDAACAGREHGDPVAVGGFAFAPEGGAAPHWEGFAPASLSVPEVSLVRLPAPVDELRTASIGARAGAGAVRLVLAALAAPDDDPERLRSALSERAAELRERPLPLLDPAPTGRFRVAGAMPPEHYEQAVASATRTIAESGLEKVVLAREVQVHAPSAYEADAIFGVLREQFPGCFVFCAGRGDATFIGASPELLVRREGQRVSTLALAGSARRSADPAVDDHIGEQLLRDAGYREEHAIVARRIERTLRPHAVWVAAAPEPGLARIANIQHLATPIRAQLAEPLDTLELVGLMHPTPAVGGEPLSLAAPLIPALEGLDRGWYAGPVGWTDAAGDGEFCVALRCALLRGDIARCFAGNGIVRDSDPARELAETEIKLAALLPLLSG